MQEIKLWEKVLNEADYADMGGVSEMVRGTSLTGETQFCGLWPSKFTPAMVTKEELHEICAPDKWANLERIASCPNRDTDQQVWDKTVSERDQSWLLGPLRPDGVPDHYPLSRRFGVVHRAGYVLGALLGEIIKECPGGGPWSIRPFDLKDACGVASSSLHHSVFAHSSWNPESRSAEIFKMLALGAWNPYIRFFVLLILKSPRPNTSRQDCLSFLTGRLQNQAQKHQNSTLLPMLWEKPSMCPGYTWAWWKLTTHNPGRMIFRSSGRAFLPQGRWRPWKLWNLEVECSSQWGSFSEESLVCGWNK